MAHTSISFPIETTLRNIQTPTITPVINNYFNNGGKIVMMESSVAQYTSGGHLNNNGLEKNGTIVIGTFAIDAYAKTMNISPLWAARDLTVHELGHAYYQQRDYITNPGDNAPIAAKVEWCMTREAEATFFSFTVAVENHAQGGNLRVPGTDSQPDLYSAMLSAIGGIDPRSSQYEIQGIAFAKNIFKNDTKYVSYCSNPDNWKRPSYLPPEDFVDDGGHGGGFGGAWNALGVYVPERIPGGYWQTPPPLPSDATGPHTEVTPLDIALVGIASTSGYKLDVMV
ncbi:hypothetical protein [Duganella violaceipulchra]|uniref:Uncharacterized protein n=1 Tax=Duganella violaceipulchra TaxID=2849652 RepID=A0AA41H7R8_9BURK|nr:hypothetical protein [Duganella violaceicalia]MBV6323643.1 hypothetical protein [Duganella violaceicalia]MCP2008997.1 hypothetical protein [Duganella violaceicalia]